MLGLYDISFYLQLDISDLYHSCISWNESLKHKVDLPQLHVLDLACSHCASAEDRPYDFRIQFKICSCERGHKYLTADKM